MTEKSNNENFYSRRDFLSAVVAVPIFLSGTANEAAVAKDDLIIASPDGQIAFLLDTKRSRLTYRVTRKNMPAIEPSNIGIVIDGNDLGSGAAIKKIEPYSANEKYTWRGVHSVAINSFRGARIKAVHSPSNTDFTIEVRVFNNGVAFRYVVPAKDNKSRVPDEATTFVLPADSTAWFHDFTGHYEGVHVKKALGEVKDGEWAAPPLTVKLPGGNGYVAITEGALINYAGMGLRADGQSGFKGVLGHALPVSHPYELRYTKADIERLAIPASFTGTITTPWRVIMIGADLNTLVNCDIINNVSPPPDKTLFPAGFATPWVRPGRAVWRYLDGGENTFDGMKEFSKLAGDLGFEHNIVEGIWHRWTEDQMRELVNYSKQFNVGIWFWEHSKNLKTPESQQKFFEQLNRVGVVGTKIDFFDHEAKEVIDQYQSLLKDAAEHKIMLEFHGANKPAGESRTWPNEMTREAIRGMEYRSMNERATHNTTLPFTRFLAGHADYTPVHFGERRRETSWAHQIATAIVFTSPVMIYGAHPKSILENPAADLIKSIPSTWDETRVLQPSEIGELAVFARRKGKEWFLGVLNGSTPKNIKVPLSFLGRGKYNAMLVRDKMDDAAAERTETATLGSTDSLSIEMRPGGGFVARFVPSTINGRV
jgi:alpha-glucosidase